MATPLAAMVGPLHLRLASEGLWSERIAKHMQAFTIPPQNGIRELSITETRRPSEHTGRKVQTLSQEVIVHYTSQPEAHVYATSIVTPRSAMRLAKRLPDVARWTHSRWLLFLRNAIELPALAALEHWFGYRTIHAATVTSRDGAVMILGDNGAGKSTLAYHLSQELGVGLGADNFSPCDGATVIGFPGSPKPKPNSQSLPIEPQPGITPLRGIISAGFDLGVSGSKEQRLRQYVSTGSEGHRGTAWDTMVAQDHTQRALQDALIAERLADLPSISYDWKKSDSVRVKEFVRQCCEL